ncbi:PD-(D/E)XK nuclease family protein [Spirosoma arcticum]
MENQGRPNLFSYATSELSQDAFICWLAAWADPKFQAADPHLHQIAREFIVSMIRKVKHDYDQANVKTVNVRRQVEKLDILIEVNKGYPDQLAILVEDKTHTDHHSGQLERYYDNATKSYSSEQIIPIYFKTGYQSKFDVGQYKTYLRKDFLDLLREGNKTVSNAIYADFLTHLERMELVVSQFLTKNLTVTDGEFAWNDNDRRGLFMRLYEQFSETDDKANWGYVANASGGFFGFWWNFEVSAQGDYWSYLQLEGDRLCYKIGFSDEIYKAENWKTKAQEVRSTWSGILLKLDEESTAKHAKIGKTMTIAKKADGVFLPKTDGTLDLDKTIQKLLETQEVLKKARQLVAVSEQV